MFGARALEARRKFLGLLPEVERRRLYEKKGFRTIYDFAAKLAGVTRNHVDDILNADRSFEDKPVLKALLENGEVSVNKLIRVISIATKENQEELAEKLKILPKSALETMVRDEKIARLNGVNLARLNGENQNLDGLQKSLFGANLLPGQSMGQLARQVENHQIEQMANATTECLTERSTNQTANTLQLSKNISRLGENMSHNLPNLPVDKSLKLLNLLSDKLKIKLLELDEKGIDINSLLLELLQKREAEIAEEKEKLAARELEKRNIAAENEDLAAREIAKMENVAADASESGKVAAGSNKNVMAGMFSANVNKNVKAGTFFAGANKHEKPKTAHNITAKPASRHIPNKIKNLLKKEHGTKCSIPGCAHDATIIHHTSRFALARSHDPRFLAPLCEEHHQLAHATDLQFWKKIKR